MLLTGTHPRTLDEKNRLVFPKRIRDLLNKPESLYITPGPDQCLWLFPPTEMQRLDEKLRQSSAADPEVRAFRRMFFGQTEEVDVDRSGRILIPERLVRFAGLGREVVLLGVQDHLELWDANRWQQYQQEQASRFDAVAEKAFQT
ncbi:MAG: transcriptional regulator MraZ [Gemmatales bacterium]|nr:MAG: transcriptional regulator MraZ [Gemmatales bacterium]